MIIRAPSQAICSIALQVALLRPETMNIGG